jgi:adenylylsulfate kinase-like enzyme
MAIPKLITRNGRRYTPDFDAALLDAEKEAGGVWRRTQGGWNGGAVGASAGTHDEDAVDYSVTGKSAAEVAKLMVDAGLIVLTAFISPFRSERRMVRELMAEGEFVEVFVNTPLEVAEARDVKGLYKKARSGALKNFTGIDSPYEVPDKPDIHIETCTLTPEKAVDRIIRVLTERGIIAEQ